MVVIVDVEYGEGTANSGFIWPAEFETASLCLAFLYRKLTQALDYLIDRSCPHRVRLVLTRVASIRRTGITPKKE